MNTEDQVSPDAETQNQAAEVTETPEVVTPDAETEVEAQPEDSQDDPEKALKRMDRRIAKRTADFYREKARADALSAELERLRGGETAKEDRKQPEDVDRLVSERVKVMTFAEKANSIVEQGTKENPEFMKVLRDLAIEVGDFVKPNGEPSRFMEAVLEVSGKPAKLLEHLGRNPDVAADLAELSPYKLAARLSDIERTLAESAKPKQSAAPKPIEPVKAKASGSALPSDDDPVDVWMAKERARMNALGLKRYG